jgi:hypothetical protein
LDRVDVGYLEAVFELRAALNVAEIVDEIASEEPTR